MLSDMPEEEEEDEIAADQGMSTDNVAAAEAVMAAEKITPERFIVDWPLFVKANVESFYPPEKISFHCSGTCNKERTWDRSYASATLAQGVSDPAIESVEYHCHHCNKERLTVVYRRMEYEERVVHPRSTGISRMPPPPPTKRRVAVKFMKVGQYPQPSVAIPKGLEKGLGEDGVSLYKKALVCRNNGYGLAAAVYMRRVVEDKTNELIEVAAELAESYEVDKETIIAIRAAADSTKYTRYEDKLRIASSVFPNTLKVGSINPLQTLYGLVSEAIHGKSEAECVDIADRTKDVFEYVFTNLRAQIAERNAFIDKVKGLNSMKGQ
jgi:hypothetical protein